MASNNRIFPWDFQEMEPHEADQLRQFDPEYSCFRVGPKGYVLPKKYKELSSVFYNLQLRSSDIFLLGLPRSGTTWTQEMVWLIENNFNYEKAKSKCLVERFPLLDDTFNVDSKKEQLLRKTCSHSDEILQVLDRRLRPIPELMAQLPSPRMVKTHLALSLLPPDLLDTSRVIYVARDPRDVVVSYYHLVKAAHGLKIDIKTFWNAFIKNTPIYTPYFENVKEAWDKRHHPNMLFLFYEDLSSDLAGSVRQVAKFLNKDITKEQLVRLCDHLSFENLKKCKPVDSVQTYMIYNAAPSEKDNSYTRRGKAGGWRDYFDEEMTRQTELWIASNLRGSDLHFPLLKNRLVNKSQK